MCGCVGTHRSEVLFCVHAPAVVPFAPVRGEGARAVVVLPRACVRGF